MKDFFSRAPAFVLSFFVLIFALDVSKRVMGGDVSSVWYLLIPLVPFLLYFVYYKEKKEVEAFEEWLFTHVDALETAQSISYEGVSITKDTELTSYNTVVSVMLLFTFVIPSGKMMEGHHHTGFFRSLSFLGTFVCGWWCIPWGLKESPVELYWNIRGGRKYTVGELMGEGKTHIKESVQKK